MQAFRSVVLDPRGHAICVCGLQGAPSATRPDLASSRTGQCRCSRQYDHRGSGTMLIGDASVVAAFTLPVPLNNTASPFSGRFQLIDQETGKPAAGRKVKPLMNTVEATAEAIGLPQAETSLCLAAGKPANRTLGEPATMRLVPWPGSGQAVGSVTRAAGLPLILPILA